MRLLLLFLGLASLWCVAGQARADWEVTNSPAPGYAIRKPNGGNGDAAQHLQLPEGITSAQSNEGSTVSGPSGTTASPDYEMQVNTVYNWVTMGPPPSLSLTFTAQADATFSSNNSSSYGHAYANASTNAGDEYAGVGVSNNSLSSSPPPQTVTFPSAFTNSFSLSASSSAYGYIYGGDSTGGNSSFTSDSASYMSYSP